jgi:hypothetical protein
MKITDKADALQKIESGAAVIILACEWLREHDAWSHLEDEERELLAVIFEALEVRALRRIITNPDSPDAAQRSE